MEEKKMETTREPSGSLPLSDGGSSIRALAPSMNATQVDLARHALGLPNKRRQSYRNHFVCGPGHSDHDNWAIMAANGFARRRAGNALSCGEDVFWLTSAGAIAAIKKGERLDQEDFPAPSPASARMEEPEGSLKARSAVNQPK